MSNIASPVWFITGCSTGFGREPRKRTIANGWPTVVAARNKNAVADLVDRKDNAFAIDLDVTSAAQITAAVTSAEDRFGRIDGLVNNAGYGYLSSASTLTRMDPGVLKLAAPGLARPNGPRPSISWWQTRAG